MQNIIYFKIILSYICNEKEFPNCKSLIKKKKEKKIIKIFFLSLKVIISKKLIIIDVKRDNYFLKYYFL